MMELTPNDQKLIDLLSKLKDSNGTYPPEILSARRQAYVQQVANAGLGIGLGASLRNLIKGGSGSSHAGMFATVSGKVLEAVLVAAIAVEAGTATYLYRDKIVDFIKTYTGTKTVQVTAPSTNPDASNNFNQNEPSATPRPTATEIPTYTVVPPLYLNNNNNIQNNNGNQNQNNQNNDNNGNPVVVNTPKPNDGNGNHFGQTPKPERTKDGNEGGKENNKP